MKIPFYSLAVLLPLASQVASASPVAEAEGANLEDRGRNDWGHNKDHNDHDNDHHYDPCKVEKPYWYHKYPCDSSEKVGESKVGDIFAPVCKYQNWYQNSKGWWVKEEYKPEHCYVKVSKCE